MYFYSRRILNPGLLFVMEHCFDVLVLFYIKDLITCLWYMPCRKRDLTLTVFLCILPVWLVDKCCKFNYMI